MIAQEQARIYKDVIRECRATGLPFALGGGFGWSIYTGYFRNTKDLDLFILERDAAAFRAVLDKCGLRDYYEKAPYDRCWISRSYQGETIIDIIWSMANRRACVDERWMDGPAAEFLGEPVRIIPAEEMIWDKLFIMQRDRCDWPDVFNLLFSGGGALDWERLLDLMGEDVRLLRGALEVFCWLSPQRARALPDWIWPRLELAAPGGGSECEIFRADLMDSRRWYLPQMKKAA